MRKDRTALVKARKAKKLLQEDIAALLGVDQSTVSRIERGLAMPSAEQAHALIAALDVTLDVIIGEDEVAA